MRSREEVLREFDAPASSLHTQRMADRIRELEARVPTGHPGTEGATREVTIKDIADIIEARLRYTNGWRVSDEMYREDCEAAAMKIAALTSAGGE